MAGGAALIAQGGIERDTDDLDAFTADAGTIRAAGEALKAACHQQGLDVEVMDSFDTFIRILVSRGEQQTIIDLARDFQPRMVVITFLGPAPSLLENAGRKLLAPFGRAEARDFSEIFALSKIFTKEDSLAEAASLDAGFDLPVLAQMMRRLERFPDDRIPGVSDFTALRQFFSSWADELTAV